MKLSDVKKPMKTLKTGNRIKEIDVNIKSFHSGILSENCEISLQDIMRMRKEREESKTVNDRKKFERISTTSFVGAIKTGSYFTISDLNLRLRYFGINQTLASTGTRMRAFAKNQCVKSRVVKGCSEFFVTKENKENEIYRWNDIERCKKKNQYTKSHNCKYVSNWIGGRIKAIAGMTIFYQGV